jgi:hypothetical protein
MVQALRVIALIKLFLIVSLQVPLLLDTAAAAIGLARYGLLILPATTAGFALAITPSSFPGRRPKTTRAILALASIISVMAALALAINLTATIFFTTHEDDLFSIALWIASLAVLVTDGLTLVFLFSCPKCHDYH